ncbi:MAG: hypothetical protein AB7O98_17830 [Hyphomonadaceae bacterium]
MLDAFPREQVLILVLEEVDASPQTHLHDAQTFLGLRPMPLPWERRNATADAARAAYPVEPATIDRLRTLLAPTIDATEHLIGRALPAWRV